MYSTNGRVRWAPRVGGRAGPRRQLFFTKVQLQNCVGAITTSYRGALRSVGSSNKSICYQIFPTESIFASISEFHVILFGKAISEDYVILFRKASSEAISEFFVILFRKAISEAISELKSSERHALKSAICPATFVGKTSFHLPIATLVEFFCTLKRDTEERR